MPLFFNTPQTWATGDYKHVHFATRSTKYTERGKTQKKTQQQLLDNSSITISEIKHGARRMSSHSNSFHNLVYHAP